MFAEKIKPPLVLTLICVIACGLLVAAYEATYVDNTGVITEKLESGLTELYGSADGFEMLKNPDGTVLTFDGVDSVLSDGTNTAFEITTNGYSTGGLYVLVGINEIGAVHGVSIMTISDTPGIGTRVQDESFLNQFRGVTQDMTVSEDSGESVKAKAVWGTRAEINTMTMGDMIADGNNGGFTLDALSGATFSSNGMYNAVKTALAAYEEYAGTKGDEG